MDGEVTTLIVPGDNNTEAEMEQISEFLAEVGSSVGKDIPFHISRFFPRSNYSDRRSTDIDTVYRLADVARKKLKYVYEGNV